MCIRDRFYAPPVRLNQKIAANVLQSFDSGAQGEHKIQRGFEPILTYSNHWIGNEGFSLAIDRFLQEERAHVESYQDEARGLLPFRRED